MTGIKNLTGDKKSLVKIAVVVGVLALLVLPTLSFAQVGTNPTGGSGVNSPVNTLSDVQRLLNNFLRILYVIFFVAAAIFIVLAAFQYLTAGGDEDKLGKAKNTLIYAIVAIAVALVATGISAVVTNFLQGATL